MGRMPILNAMNEAQHSLHLVMYGFSDEKLLQAVLAQNKKGRNVKIILEQHPYKNINQNKKTIALLKQEKINWLGHIPSLSLIHEKALIIDGRKALIMTFNFTQATFKRERNFALLIDDPKRVAGIHAIFEADWQKHSSNNDADDILASPDDSRKKITHLLGTAKKSIKIYAQSISDYKIIGELAKAAKSGIEVKVLTSNKLREQQVSYLAHAGVQIQKSKKYYIHAKVIIIDDKIAMLGSINLTRASLDNNRELAILTKESQVLSSLLAIFDTDWKRESADIAQINWLYDRRTRWQTLKMLKKPRLNQSLN